MKKFILNLKKCEKELLKRWKKNKFSKDAFPELAAEVLQKYNQHHFIKDKKDLLFWIIENKEHKDIHHYDSNSSKNVHYTLLRNHHFFIDVYLWMDHTEIHSHNFIGAFQVLSGKFEQSSFSFEGKEDFKNIHLGQLRLNKIENLKVGEVKLIPEGEKFIHQVFHGNNPSISLCIRTGDFKAPYYSYFYPGLRLTDVSFNKNELLRIKTFAQLCEIKGKFSSTAAQTLLKGIKPEAIIYEYMKGLSSLPFSQNDKSKFMKEIEKKYKKFGLKKLRTSHDRFTAKFTLDYT